MSVWLQTWHAGSSSRPRLRPASHWEIKQVKQKKIRPNTICVAHRRFMYLEPYSHPPPPASAAEVLPLTLLPPPPSPQEPEWGIRDKWRGMLVGTTCIPRLTVCQEQDWSVGSARHCYWAKTHKLAHRGSGNVTIYEFDENYRFFFTNSCDPSIGHTLRLFFTHFSIKVHKGWL
jgi:hypothetical protein